MRKIMRFNFICILLFFAVSLCYGKPAAQQQLTAEVLLRGYTDAELSNAKKILPARPEPLIGTSIPRRVSVLGNVFLDINSNGIRESSESGLADVSVTDGFHITRTNVEGNFSFAFEITGELHNRFVVMTRPTGYRSTASFFIRIPFDDKKTDYNVEFGLAQDRLSARDKFWFINTSDSQFQTLEAMLVLEKDFTQMTDAPGDPAFITHIGDLTQTGTHYQFDMYDRIRRASKIQVYDVFGGHDGNCLKPRSTINYELRVGPPYYSWDYGGVHFIQFVTETHYLRPQSQERQEAWIGADLRSIPQGMPVIVATHYPLPGSWFDKRKAEGVNVICQLAGHWHEVQAGSRGNVPVLISAPARGLDWGAYSRVYSWIHVSPKGLSSELRIAGQYERLEVVSPGKTAILGPQPLIILAYDSARKVNNVKCEIISPSGKKQRPHLTAEGDWNWYGTFNAGQTGIFKIEIEAIDSTGKKWKTHHNLEVVNKSHVAPDTDTEAFDGPGDDLYPLWIKHTGSTRAMFANPVVVRGRVYIAVNNPVAGSPGSGVLCVDGKSGKEMWYSLSPRGDIRSSVTLHNNKVYAVTGESWVVAFNADTGETLWSKPLKPEYESGRPIAINTEPPVLTDHGLLVHDWHKSIVILDYNTGAQIAEYDRNYHYKGDNAPVVKNDIMYSANRGEGGRFAMNLSSEKVLWENKESSRTTSTGIVNEDKFVFCATGVTRALDIKTGEVVWQTPVPNNGYACPTPAVWDDLILVNGQDFKALNLKTGKVVWSVPCGLESNRFERSRRQVLGGASTPAIAGDLAYFGHDDTSVRAINKNGEVKWEYRVGTPVKVDLAVSGNLLFVYDFAGNLWCFAPAEKKAK